MRDWNGEHIPGPSWWRRELPALAVLLLAALFLYGLYRAFPAFQQWVWREQCIASGRVTGC